MEKAADSCSTDFFRIKHLAGEGMVTYLRVKLDDSVRKTRRRAEHGSVI